MLDYLILTPLPVFYKVNLYNELAQSLKIFVVFLATDTKEVRAKDFNALESAKFGYKVLFKGALQARPTFSNVLKLCQILKQHPYKRLLLGGWDCVEFWAAWAFSPKFKNALVVESSLKESQIKGFKASLKRLFLKRVGLAFVCGEWHAKLLEALHFKGVVKTTHGVGIINPPKLKREPRPYAKKFICIARLSAVKNLEFLLSVFKELPHLDLSLVGIGELEAKLKGMASANVAFLGAVENSQMAGLLCAHDALVLPSIAESWGLVVEEGLAVGLPVLVSQACGAQVLVQNGVNGFVFDPTNKEAFRGLLEGFKEHYPTLLKGALAWDLEAKDSKQVGAYL
ncbi:Glycosyltransferase [Helicobacter heilmannii]|uniref:glycosyltransferase family 4 protein n=1 Tax=Helicobacter heilmannii TaxID=35817 RepID=UPI0006A1193A|nr:glycosyltransferase family 4 protein [Helicobacter heilmannii]CRF51378.1 Glycosyltransferase [Helicobacter heilmannii]